MNQTSWRIFEKHLNFLSLGTLCKQDSPVKTHGEATCYSRTSTGSERRRGNKGLDIRDDVKHKKQAWRPLLLFIPLRLGLSEMNSVYNEPFKVKKVQTECVLWNHCDV